MQPACKARVSNEQYRRSKEHQDLYGEVTTCMIPLLVNFCKILFNYCLIVTLFSGQCKICIYIQYATNPLKVNFDHSWYEFTLLSVKHSTGRQLTDHGGLLNMGNTCYANATLQLLYHCPDFRLAVLENPRIQSISAKPVSAKQSALTEKAELSSTVDPAILGESRGGLHLQLFSLFRSLSTHMVSQ